MQRPVNSLSDKGFIESPKLILSRKIADYILTDAAQSLTMKEELISLPATYHRFINDPEGMARQVREDVQNLLGHYFDSVEDIRADVEMDDKASATIALYATVRDVYGKEHGLGNIVYMDPDGLGKVVGINNYGDALRYMKKRPREISE